MVAWNGDDGPDGAGQTVIVERRRPRKIVRVTRIMVFGLIGLIALVALILWLQRKPIADNVIAREFEKRGVQASYRLDRIGFRTQEVSDLVIGDPAAPDLVARKAVIQMRVKLNGSVEFYRVVARGVRLNAVVKDGKVSFGQVDRLLPPPSGKPFTLPNLVVDLADTTVRIDTPYGRIGAALAGVGNLSGGFKGRMALAAPRLDPGRCAARAVRASLAVDVRARRPHMVGPLQADSLACPSSRLDIAQVRLDLDSRFSEGFDTAEGTGRLTAARFVLGDNGLARLTSRISFRGTPTEVGGKVDLGARALRSSAVGAARARFAGGYRFDLADGQLAVDGDFATTATRLSPALLAGVTGPLKSAEKSPVGPIAARIANAIDQFADQFDAVGHLSLVNFAGGGGVRVADLRATGRDGASVASNGGDGIRYFWPSGKMRLDTELVTRGGALPDARIALRQQRLGAPLTGQADIAPYAAGSARLALSPVRFGPSGDGGTSLTTTALLDGPFPGGQVRGLRLPLVMRFGGAGGLRVGEGCIDARFAALRVGSLSIGQSRVPLCPTNGSSLITQTAGGRLLIGMATRDLRLRGTLGRSPFALDAARAQFVGEDRFTAAALALRMGQADAPVRLTAASFDGTFVGAGARGNFGGGTAVIGKVPLDLTDLRGQWTFAKGDLSVDGALTVSDQYEPARFYPLASDDVRFTLSDNIIRTTGTLRHPASGTRVSDVSITHDLGNGEGAAVLDVPGIRFAEKGLQPDDLTRLSEGVIALVNGSLDGQGRIAWNSGGKVTSDGEFNVRDTNLAAAFGPVTGLSTTIRFTDLLGLETAPGGVLAMETINPGILVGNGVIRYQLLPGQLVKIERGEWPFMGGTLVLQETILNFARPTPKRLTFEVIGLDAKQFVDSMGFQDIEVTGVFDGVLPMIFDDEGGRIVGGRLDSRPGGGVLQYKGVVSKANLGMMGGLAFDALRHLRYSTMIVRLDGNLDGEFATRLTIDQVALGETTTARFLRAINKVPFKFNVSIVGPFRALIGTAKSFRDPQPVISDVLPMPLDQIPGAVVEVRRTEEQEAQSQTPVNQQVEVGAPPEPEPQPQPQRP